MSLSNFFIGFCRHFMWRFFLHATIYFLLFHFDYQAHKQKQSQSPVIFKPVCLNLAQATTDLIELFFDRLNTTQAQMTRSCIDTLLSD